jgi:hypothetical protein
MKCEALHKIEPFLNSLNILESNGTTRWEQIGEFDYPILNQKIYILLVESDILICRVGPRELGTRNSPQTVLNSMLIPKNTFQAVINHIEGCLVKRREYRGLPWDKEIESASHHIKVMRIYGLGPNKKNYGYTISNVARNETLGFDDELLLKRGFLSFLKETIKT